MEIKRINGYLRQVLTEDELREIDELNQKKEKLRKKNAEDLLIAQGINSPEEIKRKIIESE